MDCKVTLNGGGGTARRGQEWRLVKIKFVEGEGVRRVWGKKGLDKDGQRVVSIHGCGN